MEWEIYSIKPKRDANSNILKITDGKETLYFQSWDCEDYQSGICKISRSDFRKLSKYIEET